MKKDSNEPVKLDGKVEGLKKYIHSGRNHVTFKVNNKQVTIDTGYSPMFIENGDDVVAVGMTDNVGNMAPHIFSNKSRSIYIQTFSEKKPIIFIPFFSILAATCFTFIANLLLNHTPIEFLGQLLTLNYSLLFGLGLFGTVGAVWNYRYMIDCKKMLSML